VHRSGGLLALLAACVMSLVLLVAPAQVGAKSGLYDGTTGRAVSLEQALQAVHPGHIVIVSEEHDVEQHHVNQLAVLQVLKRLRLKISVGFEFLSYPGQPRVDEYVRGDLQEPEFLRAVHWGGYPFDWYRPLVLFPVEAGGFTLALNAPEPLARALAQKGVGGLSDTERSMLPPDFQLGSARYFERFASAVGQHGELSGNAIRNFFAAQSAWDDTMAWQAVEYLRSHPDQVLVVIVGDFHASYGGGLPDRLRARGATKVLVISQVEGSGLDDAELQKSRMPDPRYGVRADFVWLTWSPTSSLQGRAQLMQWLENVKISCPVTRPTPGTSLAVSAAMRLATGCPLTTTKSTLVLIAPQS